MTGKNSRKILVLGNTGKLGQAITTAFAPKYEVIGLNSSTFDAGDFDQVRLLIEEHRPDLLCNAVAFNGIDQCEADPDKALRINAMLPRLLAECSVAGNFTLVHFSTDSVFSDAADDAAYSESAPPSPLNMYGLTKYGGDCFVRSIARNYYIFRLSILFGPNDRHNQFVEKMLARIKAGQETLRIADDVIASPTFTRDVADTVKQMVEQQADYGLYHLANAGSASLYELMEKITTELALKIAVEKGSHRDFHAVGRKNIRTPLCSEKIPAMRPWQEAVAAYCQYLEKEWRHTDD